MSILKEEWVVVIKTEYWFRMALYYCSSGKLSRDKIFEVASNKASHRLNFENHYIIT